MDAYIYIALLAMGIAFGLTGWKFKPLRFPFFTLSSILLIVLSLFKDVEITKLVKTQEIIVNSSLTAYNYSTITITKNIEPLNWLVFFIGVIFLMGLFAEAYFAMKRRWREIYGD
ncbi:hypothetical protein ACO3UB_08440 (plasmid) [Methanocaldococcus sp. 16A]